MSGRVLSDAQVTAIRTSGLTDSWWSRTLRISLQTVRDARQGIRYRHVPTPPDIAPRDGTGCTHAIRKGLPQKAVPARQRMQWGDL